ncbi:MAG: ABC transporter substrate-binding protein [Nitrospirota bacterium]
MLGQVKKGVIPFLFLSLIFSYACKDTDLKKKPESAQKTYGGTYRSPLPFEPKTLDPALSTDIYAVTVIQQIYDGLVQFDKDLNIIPAIAKSWKISLDGLTYTFYLREGVRFHNGKDVTAEDFIYSFTRILDPDVKSSSVGFFTNILGVKEFQRGLSKSVKGLKAPSKYTLGITLSKPYSPFITILAMKGAKVVPKEEVKKWGKDFGKHPVGTGGFKFVSWRDNEIVLEANKDYFEGRPILDRIVYKIFPGRDVEKMFKEFASGGLENSEIPDNIRDDVIKSRKYYVIKRPILSLLFHGLNTKIIPLNNKKIRQAINFAINKEKIIQEAYNGKHIKADAILPPGIPGYERKEIGYPYNPEKAKRLLSEAGHPEGRGIPTFEIWSAATTEATRKELEIVKANLKDIGINVELKYEKRWPVYESYLNRKRLPIFRYIWYADFPDPDNFLAILSHSNSQYNFTYYKNKHVDKMLEDAKSELDFIKRMGIYRMAEREIMKGVPIAPLLHLSYEEAYQPYVNGIEVNALGSPYIPMKKVWFSR